MTYNEAETRFYLIDPVLRDNGYDAHQWLKLETPAPVEPTGPKGRRRKGGGRTDYLLCVRAGEMPKPLPVAVPEAKKETEDPLKGMQQAKRYADCRRHDIKYVFSTNGHRYGEFDFYTQLHGGPTPFVDFPCHGDLTTRYAKDTGIDLNTPAAAMLFMADSPAYPQSRYYQDAAIRAAFEKIIRCRRHSEPARVLLSMATGSGKTIIAANLLWRLHQAGQLPKPALFLCDRDELRGQAYNKLKAVFGDNARIVQTSKGKNAARNARIHIATYQTLGLDADADEIASFLTQHYFFTLSQVYEDLLLKMGEKNSDGGQFFTPREVIRAMVLAVDPRPGETVYDPGCGTGGFLAVAYEHMFRNLGKRLAATAIEQLKHATFFGREKETLVFPIALANKEQLKAQKKAKVGKPALQKLQHKIKAREKEVREAKAKAN